MAVVVKIRRGTTTQWSSSTKVLQIGELGIDTTLNKIKAGNGTSLWPDLPWLHITPTELTSQAASTLDSANDYTDTAIASLGNTADLTYVPVSDVGNADGVAPLDSNTLIPDQYIPSTIARDSELFRSAVEWTANHYQLSGGANTRYLAGDVVWHNGNIYIANYDNESLPTSNTQYWTLLGTGKRLNIDGRDIPNITYDQLNGKPVIPDLTGYATETYVGTAISNLVDSAPTTLNTLNELAAALGDDANYATTITTALGDKLDSTTAASTYLTQTSASSTYAPIASPTFTGTVSGISKSMVGLGNVDNTTDANKPISTATQTALDAKSNQIVTINAQSSSYTIATSDLDKMVEMSGGGTLTITDSSSFPVGFTCNILQTGSSQVTIAGTGFTPNATPGLKLRTQWSSATLVKRSLNSWVVMGDLSA